MKRPLWLVEELLIVTIVIEILAIAYVAIGYVITKLVPP